MDTVDLNLRDYLSPGGSYPYEMLFVHANKALAEGKKVYLWSVPGFLMVSGWPGEKKPWMTGADIGGHRVKTFRDLREALMI